MLPDVPGLNQPKTSQHLSPRTTLQSPQLPPNISSLEMERYKRPLAIIHRLLLRVLTAKSFQSRPDFELSKAQA